MSINTDYNTLKEIFEKASNSIKNEEAAILERFIRYVKIWTTSSPGSDTFPSSECQWELLELLERELKEMGLETVTLDTNGYISALIPPSEGYENAPIIGFLAHVDTAPDVSGKNVKPIIHQNYNGETIILSEGVSIDPKEYPELLNHKGQTVITTDGTTLLGADDKAGVAEIMTATYFLLNNKEFKHGPIEIYFTPDEEIGKGMDKFPLKNAKSLFCYTMDGDGEGNMESECFNAASAHIKIEGKVVHLGSARGQLVNSVKIASEFVTMLPHGESPEATDGRYGYYCPHRISGTLEEATIELVLRDFHKEGMEKRINTVKTVAAALENLYSGSKISVEISRQYSNMIEFIGKESLGMKLLSRAIEFSGAIPALKIIRGGTDGARLSEMGIPCPNVFTGGHNYHSRQEWAALSSMVKATAVIVSLAMLWADC